MAADTQDQEPGARSAGTRGRPPEPAGPSRHEAPEGMLATRVLAVVGLLVGAVGVATALVTGSWRVWPLVMLVVAAGLAFVFVLTNADWLIHYVVTKKALISVNTLIALAVACAILTMVNVLSYRRFWRHDFSQSQLYQLSSQTRNIVSSLTQPISIVTFYDPGSPDGYDFGEYLRRLLGEYTVLSSRVTTEFVRTDTDPVRVRELVKKYEVTADNTVVVLAGEQRKNVAATDIVRYEGGEMYGMPTRTTYAGESAITSAIKAVTETRRKKVSFVTGHKERSPTDSGETGFSSAARLLRGANYEVPEPVNLLTGGVPEDCDLVIIAGPEEPFRPEEVEALARYLEAGRPALFLVDPVWDTHGQFVRFGFEPLLEGRGVLLKDALVLDPKSALEYPSNPVPTSITPYHEITKELSGENMVFQVARPLEAKGGEKEATVTPLLGTSPESWGEVSVQTEETGEPTGGGANVLEDGSKRWVKDQWAGGQLVLVTDIPGEQPKRIQQLAHVVANTETVLTIRERFDQVPDGQKKQQYLLRKPMGFTEGVDLKGPLTLAMASSRREAGARGEGAPMGAEPPGETARLVVVGDSDFASNNSVDALPGHQNLFLNSVSWLVGHGEDIGIRPKNPELTALTLSPQQFQALSWLVLVAMPAAVVLAGCVVWWLRRLD